MLSQHQTKYLSSCFLYSLFTHLLLPRIPPHNQLLPPWEKKLITFVNRFVVPKPRQIRLFCNNSIYILLWVSKPNGNRILSSCTSPKGDGTGTEADQSMLYLGSWNADSSSHASKEIESSMRAWRKLPLKARKFWPWEQTCPGKLVFLGYALDISFRGSRSYCDVGSIPLTSPSWKLANQKGAPFGLAWLHRESYLPLFWTHHLIDPTNVKIITPISEAVKLFCSLRSCRIFQRVGRLVSLYL